VCEVKTKLTTHEYNPYDIQSVTQFNQQLSTDDIQKFSVKHMEVRRELLELQEDVS